MSEQSLHLSVRERFNISRIAIQHPWLTLGFWIAVMVAGILAFSSLKYALFPDITFPVVVVNAEAPIATATDTESSLTDVIERGLQSLKNQGLDEIESSTFPGRTIVNLSFQVGTDLNESTDRVSTLVKQLTLPAATTFTVTPVNLNEASVISYALVSTKQSLAQLTQTAQNRVVPAIAQVPGVLKVRLLGSPAGAPVKSSTLRNGVEAEVLTPGSSAIRFNSREALALEIIKRSNANTLEVVSDTEKAVQNLQLSLPDVQLNLAETQAGYIQEATQSTIDALVLAIALSIIVIFPFLWNWKATLISALAIPTSLLGTFIVMAIGGFNLDTITLLALALVIGIIVDDAIVDVENISRHIEAGEKPRTAAVQATNEIGLTVTAATFAIVAVFLPIGLMHGVLGQFFKPFGITVSAAVIISLLVARTLSPLLAVYWIRPKGDRGESKGWIEFVNRYRLLLNWALKHRWTVVGIALLSFVAGIALIPSIPKGFIPQLDRGEFLVNFTAPLPTVSANPTQPPSNLLSNTIVAAQQIETAVLKAPEVSTVYTTIGSRGQPNEGSLYVKLQNQRTLSTGEVEDQVRNQIRAIAGVNSDVQDIPFVETGSQKPIEVALYGNDPTALSQTATAIQQRLEKVPGFADITISGTGSQKESLEEIDHRNGRRVAYISAGLQKGLALGDATDRVVAIANQVKSPGVRIDLGSDSSTMNQVFESFGVTLALSILCILVVLLALFRSWTDPLVIILSLPLAVLGALIATLIARAEFGMISVIGIIFLLGLTNKNAILLVDYINQRRREGETRSKAILEAAPIRLRPILMTTSAMILGMLPIALGLGAGAELRAPMAIAIIGGLITSTLLSLLVIPVVYTLLDDLKSKLFRRPRFSR